MGALAAYLSDSLAAIPPVLRRMLEAAPHRGSHVSILMEGRCGVGVASRDDGTDSSVAMRDGLAVAVVGTIDNISELADRWDLRGRPLLSTADVVLAGYQRLADETPVHLRGSYSAVVTDGSSLHAFRDHVGFGLLHYGADGTGTYVGTEAKQILSGTTQPRAPEMAFLDGLVFDQYEDETLCALAGVRRVPQGSVLSASSTGMRWSRYWRPEDLLETTRLRPDEVQERFDELMTQAVTRVLTGEDVIALSGGIDSPAVAAYAAPGYRTRYGRPLAALSAVQPEFPRMDERASVELIAQALGLELHLYGPRASPLDGLRASVRLCDGPAPSSFSRPSEMYRVARGLGFRTILSGNYAEFLTDVGQEHLVPHLVRTGRIDALRTLFRNERARGVGAAAVARQMVRGLLPAGVLDAFDVRRHARRLGPDWLDAARLALRAPKHVPSHGRWRRSQLASFYVPRLAIEADDIEQAASGVRVRWPWMDVDLWEFFLRLPAETKYPDLRPRKLLVRELLRGKLPDPILDRQEKVTVDDAAMRSLIDYGLLRDLLRRARVRLPGVNYERLGRHLEREDLPARDFRHLRVLAAIHVFLEEW